MIDREKVIKKLAVTIQSDSEEWDTVELPIEQAKDILTLLKEQENKRTTPHKKHTITWSRNEPFSAGELYETICKTLFDEGELFIERTYKHDKVDCVFYVTDGR